MDKTLILREVNLHNIREFVNESNILCVTGRRLPIELKHGINNSNDLL